MMNAEQHLDLNALQDLKDIMEAEYETLVNTFITDSERKLEEMGQVVEAGDPETLRKLAHSLKGSSSNVCALKLSELARELEAMGKEGETSGADYALAQLKLEFSQVARILNDSLHA